MFLEFIANESKRYSIIRDYFTSNGNKQGIYFIVKDEESSEVKKIFLDKEEMSNEFFPKKAKGEDVQFKASGIENGEENVLIVETGVWKKKGAFNHIKEYSAKKYRFILEEKK